MGLAAVLAGSVLALAQEAAASAEAQASQHHATNTNASNNTSNNASDKNNNNTRRHVGSRAVDSTGAAPAEVNPTRGPSPPGKPTGFSATARNASVDLTWNDPQDSSITRYEYQSATSSPFGREPWKSIPGSGATTTSFTVGNLNNGTQYYFRIRAVNAGGDSPESDTKTATPTAPPSAPTGLTATTLSGQVTINWTGPSELTITGYQYQYKLHGAANWPESWTNVPSSSNATRSTGAITGLTNGTRYNFGVRAVSAFGNGAAATLDAAPGLPAAPTNLSATFVGTEVTLSWVNPNNAAISGYKYRQKTGTAVYGNWTPIPGSTAATTTYKVTGLNSGTAYKFKLRAVTGAGDGPESAEATARPPSPPSAPTGLAAAPGDTRVKLTWSDPGDSSITGYEYCRKTGTATCNSTRDSDWSAIGGSGATTTSATIGDLHNGTAYKFRIRAVNAHGNGTMSAATTVTPVKVRLAVAPNFVAEGATATVRAYLDGGAATADITVTVAAAAGTAESGDYTVSTNKTLMIQSGASHSSGVVTIATNSDTDTADETVTVSGTVSGGGGFLSAPANSTLTINDKARPQMVFILNGAVVRGGAVTIVEGSSTPMRLRAVGALAADGATCTPRAGIGGGSAEANDVTFPERGDVFTWPSRGGTDVLSSNTLTILANSDADTDDEHTFLRIADEGCTDRVPAGDKAHLPLAIRLTVLDDDAPRVTLSVSPNRLAEGSSATVTAAWSGTASTAATTVTVAATGISAASDDFSLSTNKTLTIAAGATTSTGTVTITANSDADSLDETVRVSAVATNTTDNPIAPHERTLFIFDDERLPDAPLGLTATRGNAKVTLAWTGPANPTIDKYQYCAKSSGSCDASSAGDWTDMTASGASTRRYVVGGLTNGTAYNFRVRAVNPAGAGAVSARVSATPATVPAAVTGLTAVAASGQVTLNWTGPSDSTISKYQYQYRTSGDRWPDNWSDVSGSSSSTRTTGAITGLTNGTAYNFRVRAVNSTGGGAAVTVNATPNPVPSMPTSFSATAKNAGVVLTWAIPADTSGSTNNTSITKFQYQQRTTESNWTGINWTDIPNTTGTSESGTISGLSNGTAYTFRIRAVNPSGNSTPTAAGTATPPGRPAKPTGFTATPKNAAVDLAWTNPDNSAISKWQYQRKLTSEPDPDPDPPGGRGTSQPSASSTSDWPSSWTDVPQSSATTTSYTVPSLTNGTSYDFRIRAVTGGTGGGPGPESDVKSATPAAAPAAPTGLTAVVASGQVTLNWTGPTDSSITKYQYQYKLNTDNWPSTWTDISGSSSSTRTTGAITGLTNGSLYNFRVRAVNPTGDGAAATVNATPPTVPGAPTGFSATAGNAKVALAWANPNNSSITRWEYRQKTGTAAYASWTPIPSSSASTTSFDVTGLTNGTEYRFKIRAVNATGDGAESGERTATPPGSPAKPAGFTASPRSASVVLSWTNPSNSAISKWQFQYKASSASNWITWADVPQSGAATTTHTVSSLSNGTAYDFQVRAVTGGTGGGNGPASDTESATPVPAPAAPTGVSAAPANGLVTLSWANPNNSTITEYQLNQKVGSDAYSGWNPITSSTSSTTSVLITATNGTVYKFKIRAKNHSGVGAESVEVTVTPNPVPTAMSGFGTTAGNAKVTLAWTIPANTSGTTNNTTITKFQYQQRLSTASDWTGASWADIPSTTGTSTSGTISTGITNGTAYDFRIRAVNPTGNGPASDDASATPPGLPAKPAGFTASPRNVSVYLSWTNPSNSAISKWQFQSKLGTAANWPGSWSDVPQSTATTTNHTVSSLTNGTEYDFRIRAVTGGTGGGNGPASDTKSATPVPAPAAPTGLTAVVASGQVTLNWTGPSDTSITKYQYQYKLNTAANWPSTWTDISGSGSSTRTTGAISGLTNASLYNFRVRAVNLSGDGAPASVNATPIGLPGAPANFTATAGNTRVTLTWDNPNNASITRYDICQKTASTATCSSGDWSPIANSDSSTVQHIVTSLSNGTTYAFRVRAVNNTGNGTASASASASPAIQPPSTPTGLTAFPYDTSVTLSWSDPQDSSITKYQVRRSNSSTFSGGWSAANDITSSATTTRHWVSPLTKGQTYWFQLRAVNSGGAGPVATVMVTPGAPDAPYDLAATPGNAKVTLTWGRPYNDPAITKWQYCHKTGSVTCDPGQSTDWTDITGDNSTTRSVVSSGLTNDTEYKFRLRAVGTYTGAPSAVVTATPSASATPAAPSGLSITARNASVTLTWDNPSDSSITKYQHCQPASRTDSCTNWSDFNPAASSTSGSVSGLTNNQKYWFRIRAVNSGGGGDPSVALTATPLAAPVLQTPKVADGEAVLVWSPVTGATRYQYCGTTGGAACTATDWLNTQADEPEKPNDHPNTVTMTVRFLTNDTAYTFRVRAVNDGETIVESNAVTVTPTRKPGRVTGLRATAAAGQVTLTWTAPATTTWRGTPTDYEYCQKTGTATCSESRDADWTATGSTSTSKVVSPLTNGRTYIFRVRAVNGAGVGAASDAITARPVAVPGAIVGLAATATGDRTITLTWTASTDASIQKYQYCQVQGSTAACSTSQSWADIADSSYTTSSHVVVGLLNGTQYAYRVRAVNAAGNGASGATVTATPQGKPGAPTGVTATPGVGRITLAWAAPVGWSITGYQYCQKTGAATCDAANSADWTPMAGAGAATTSYAVTGLSNGTAYRFSVRAVNGSGNGVASARTAAVSPTTTPAPAQPRNLTVARVADGSVTLRWTWTAAPGGGRPLLQMGALTWRLSGVGAEKTLTPKPLRIGYDRASGTGTFEYTETGLTNGQQYTLAVKARRDGTDGDASASVAATPTATPPPWRPDSFSATVVADDPGEVVIRWGYFLDTLLDPNFVGPTGWQYELNGVWTNGEHCDGGCSGMWTTLRLQAATTYTIRVRALNGSTPGAASAAITITTATAG